MSNDDTIELRAVEGKSQSQLVRERFFHHKAAVISIIVLLAIIILAISSVGYGFIPGWWKWPVNVTSPLLDDGYPNSEHPFGQDKIGNDIFALVMRGIQQSLTVMFIMGIVATIIGVLFGTIAGFYGGWIDSLLMRIADGFIIIPTIVVGAILGKIFNGATAWGLGLAFGFIIWMSMARLVRAEFLVLRELEFVDAAKVAGASNFRIIFRHILPNTMGVIIVNATLLMSLSILLETALSFLGFGIRWPDVSLGNIISQNQTAFETRPWLFWWPGLFIVLIALCVNFIGDGLRDAFDPKQRKIPSKAKMLKAFASRDLKTEVEQFRNLPQKVQDSLTNPESEIQNKVIESIDDQINNPTNNGYNPSTNKDQKDE